MMEASDSRSYSGADVRNHFSRKGGETHRFDGDIVSRLDRRRLCYYDDSQIAGSVQREKSDVDVFRNDEFRFEGGGRFVELSD